MNVRWEYGVDILESKKQGKKTIVYETDFMRCLFYLLIFREETAKETQSDVKVTCRTF